MVMAEVGMCTRETVSFWDPPAAMLWQVSLYRPSDGTERDALFLESLQVRDFVVY